MPVLLCRMPALHSRLHLVLRQKTFVSSGESLAVHISDIMSLFIPRQDCLVRSTVTAEQHKEASWRAGQLMTLLGKVHALEAALQAAQSRVRFKAAHAFLVRHARLWCATTQSLTCSGR